MRYYNFSSDLEVQSMHKFTNSVGDSTILVYATSTTDCTNGGGKSGILFRIRKSSGDYYNGVGVKIQIGDTSCFKIHQHAIAYDSQSLRLYILATNAYGTSPTTKTTVLFTIDPTKAGSAMIEAAQKIVNGENWVWRHYSAILSINKSFLPVAGFSQKESECFLHIAGVS